MELGEWGEPVASYDADPHEAGGTRTTALVLLALGAVGFVAVTARGHGLFDDGLFLVPSLALGLGATFLALATAARRGAMRVGRGWFVQRSGALGTVRGFRVEDVVRVRTTAPAYVQGRRVVSLVVDTAAGQRHHVPFHDAEATRAVRTHLARQLLESGADRDPSAETLLRTTVGASGDLLVLGPAGADPGSLDAPARLDEDGRLRWPAGTFQMVVPGVAFTLVGLGGLVMALAGAGIFDQPDDPSVYALVAGPLVVGPFNLWLLRHRRRRDVAAWRARRGGSARS